MYLVLGVFMVKLISDATFVIFPIVSAICFIAHPTGVRDSSVGIARRYGLDGPGIKFWWGPRFFIQTGSEASCTTGTGSLPGVKRPGRVADHPSPLLEPRLRIVWSYTFTSPLCLYRHAIR
jgi:hypothetical protein